MFTSNCYYILKLGFCYIPILNVMYWKFIYNMKFTTGSHCWSDEECIADLVYLSFIYDMVKEEYRPNYL